MTSRFSAARPKRTGEAFARAHHGDDAARDGPSSNKKVRFDVRNPSALAPGAGAGDDGDGDGDYDYDEADEQVLAADVIRGATGATKRGAVNVDGYDSDSDNETFYARAAAREKSMKKKMKGKAKKGGTEAVEEVDLADQMDNYHSGPAPGAGGGGGDEDVDEEEIDMFGAADEDDEEDGDGADGGGAGKRGGTAKEYKEVRFLRNENIEGQEKSSRSGGTVRLDEAPSSGDEDEIELAIQEEDVDEEVGLAGLKRHAPKIDAFNMKQEQEEGAFDEAGNYIRRAVDPDAVHDRWLEGLSKREMKKAAAAHEKREAERRQQRRDDDSVVTADLFGSLIGRLERGETPLEALARLGKKSKTKAKVPKWKQKKRTKNGADGMDVDVEAAAEDPEQARVKAAIDSITEAADRLLKRDYPDIYDTEREVMEREYRNETGEAWVAPQKEEDADDHGDRPARNWEYRWIDGRDGGALQGPFDGATMKAWQDAGYFGEGVEFRPAGEEGGWTRIATFV